MARFAGGQCRRHEQPHDGFRTHRRGSEGQRAARRPASTVVFIADCRAEPRVCRRARLPRHGERIGGCDAPPLQRQRDGPAVTSSKEKQKSCMQEAFNSIGNISSASAFRSACRPGPAPTRSARRRRGPAVAAVRVPGGRQAELRYADGSPSRRLFGDLGARSQTHFGVRVL